MKAGFLQPLYPADAGGEAHKETADYIFGCIARSECDLIVLPEYSNVAGLLSPGPMLEAAEEGADAFLQRVSTAAVSAGTAVAANILQAGAGGPRNVTWLFDSSGRAAGSYVKTHITPFERDSLRLVPGGGARAVELGGIRVGFLTCFDIYFAEFAERLADLRPDIVVFPSYQRSEKSSVIVRQASGRALDMEAYMVRASYAVGEVGRGGHSLVAAPDGEVLVDAGAETGLFAYEIDPLRKRPRPQSYGMPELSSRDIVESGRRRELYRPAGSGAAHSDALPYPRVIAHRGLSGPCPENTLPALAAAVALGADEIEFDIWASRDGEIVLCHDRDVKRTSNSEGLIAELDWVDISRLDAGGWKGAEWSGLKFCRLEDVFGHLGGRTVMNIHIKEPGPSGAVIRRLYELALQYGITDKIYIAGARDVLELSREIAPEIERCCLEGADGAAKVEFALQNGCRRVQFWNPRLTADDIKLARENGIICNLFYGDSPDTAEEAGRMISSGIDAFLTNWANKVLPAVRAPNS